LDDSPDMPVGVFPSAVRENHRRELPPVPLSHEVGSHADPDVYRARLRGEARNPGLGPGAVEAQQATSSSRTLQ